MATDRGMRPWGPRAGDHAEGRLFSRRNDRDSLPRGASEWAVTPKALREDTEPDPRSVSLMLLHGLAVRVR